MRINGKNITYNISNYQQKNDKSKNCFFTNKTNSYTFVKPDKEHKKKLPTILCAIALPLAVLSVILLGFKKNKTNLNTNSYINELASDLSSYTGEKIKSTDLSSILSKNEFLEMISKLNKENYEPSKFNIEKGIFRADLHSHTDFSDGLGKVENILDEVANYANSVKQKNGQPFLFAITDHNTADGVKNALSIIAKNPKKFENVKFITGAEISYGFPAKNISNPSETAEILVYGFNPFSKNTEKFFNGIHNKKLNMVNEFIQKGKEFYPNINFSYEEFQKAHNLHGPLIKMNLHWDVFHYLETKHAASIIAKEKGLNSEKYYESVINSLREKHMPLFLSNLQAIDSKFGTFHENNDLKHVCQNIFAPKVENGKIISAKGENLFEDIINSLKDEKNIVAGFAHPAYLAQYLKGDNMDVDYNAVFNLFREKIQNSNGLIQLTEAHHQAYKEDIVSQFMQYKINNKLTNLIPIGGRDNHAATWLGL